MTLCWPTSVQEVMSRLQNSLKIVIKMNNLCTHVTLGGLRSLLICRQSVRKELLSLCCDSTIQR